MKKKILLLASMFVFSSSALFADEPITYTTYTIPMGALTIDSSINYGEYLNNNETYSYYNSVDANNAQVTIDGGTATDPIIITIGGTTSAGTWTANTQSSSTMTVEEDSNVKFLLSENSDATTGTFNIKGNYTLEANSTVSIDANFTQTNHSGNYWYLTIEDNASLKITGTATLKNNLLLSGGFLTVAGSLTISSGNVAGITVEFDENYLSNKAIITANSFVISSMPEEITLDFTDVDIANKLDVVDEYVYTLFDTSKAMDLDSISSYITTTGLDEDIYDVNFSLSADETDFLVTVTAIPEPSTYAMILGTLALAFAYYRRRK